MKKIIVVAIITLGLSGCFKKDEFQNIDILTTSYSAEYITETLYGEHSTVENIYPDGIEVSKYVVTNKRIKDYGESDLFIYNGLSQEKEIAANLLNKYKKIKIIDISQGLEIEQEEEELWINPTNKLMIAQNIKNGLKNYIQNKSILKEVDQKYEDLKVIISEFDAELNLIGENAKNNNIIVANNSLTFLEKYGFNVIKINDSNPSSADYSKANKLFKNGSNNYLFALDTIDVENEDIKNLVKSGAEVKKINTFKTLSEKDRKNKENYETLMNKFIEYIKEEVY